MKSIRTITLDIPALVCESVIAATKASAPSGITEFRIAPGTKAVEIATASEVLYVPDIRMQIVGKTVVPSEAVFDPWELEYARKNGLWGRGAAYENSFAASYSDDDVCILSNFYSHNFFHWIAEELIKVFILERSGFKGRYVMVNLPAFTTQMISMLGVTPERMITSLDAPTVFKSAVYTTAVSTSVIDYPELYRTMRAAIVDAAPPKPDRRHARRLWLDRDEAVSRPGGLINKDEVYPILSRHGFEILDMAKLPIAEQIAAAANASVLAGPHGAGFVHCLFMPPDSTVIECFSPGFINPSNLDICRVMNHSYFMIVHANVFDAYPYGVDLKVNCKHLELVLQKLR